MDIYQRPAFLILVTAFCALVAISGAVASASWLNEGAILRSFLAGLITAAAAFAALHYYRRFRAPQAVLTLTPHGFTNEYGQEFTWDQVAKIYKFTGVLFICDHSKAGWIVRIDPAEVGGKRLSQAIAFIKANAPAHLTTKL